MVPILGTCISGGEAVYEGCKGNGTQALVKVGETLVSGVADVFTISTFGGSTLFTTSLTSFGKVGTTIASKKIVERAVITGGCLVAKHHLIQHNSYGVSDSSGDSYAHKEAARSQSPREKKLSNSGRKNSSAGVGGAGVGSAGGGGERPHNSNLKSSHEQDSIASEFLLYYSVSSNLLKKYEAQMEQRVQDQDVQELINKQLTKDDGRGTIYIYYNRGDIGFFPWPYSYVFKIGMTKLDPRARISAQERRNNSEYHIFYCGSSYHRRRVERVAHLMLQNYRLPQRPIEGGTEWFSGEKELHMAAIIVAEKYVTKRWGKSKSQ